MRIAAAQKQQLAFMVLLTGVSLAASNMLAAAGSEHTLTYVIGAIGCILAFLNAELAIYFLIIAMLLSPEISVGSRTEGASLRRAVTLRVDDFVLLIICLTWFIKSVLYKEINLLKRTPLNSAMYLYSFFALFSTLLGVLSGNVDPKTGFLFVLKYFEYFLVFWMVVNTAHDEGQIRRFLFVTILVAVIVSFVAISQIPHGGRVSAPFEGENGEPNTLGGYLLFIMSILGAVSLAENKYRWFALVALMIALVAFTYTLSRASYLGLLPVVFLVPLIMRRYVLVVAMIIGFVGVLAFADKVLPPIVYRRIAYTFDQTSTHARQVQVLGRRVDTSTSTRLFYMQAAFDALVDKPVFGWGVTGWHFIDSQYFRSLSETGIVGFATLVFLLCRVLQTAWRSLVLMRDRDPLFFALAAGFIAGTVGLIVHAIGSNTFIIVRIMEPFWLVCALVYLLPIVTTAGQAKAV